MSSESPAHNPALAPLKPLIGSWRVTLSHASFLDDPQATLSGTASLEWLDDAFVMVRSSFDAGPPKSWSVIGRNESLDTYSMLYYDDRGVSRIYSMDFDGNTITAAWEKSDDRGASWQHDFDLTYVRAG